MENPDDLIAVAKYEDAPTAYIAKGMLESNGIEAAVMNEIMSTILPLTPMPFAQVRLMVRRSDVDMATRLLKECDQESTINHKNEFDVPMDSIYG